MGRVMARGERERVREEERRGEGVEGGERGEIE